MGHAGRLEERQCINIAESERVANVEIGASTAQAGISGIHEQGIAAIRRVVDGVAERVTGAQRESAHATARGDLERVINGIRGRLDTSDAADTLKVTIVIAGAVLLQATKRFWRTCVSVTATRLVPSVPEIRSEIGWPFWGFIEFEGSLKKVKLLQSPFGLTGLTPLSAIAPNLSRT